MDKVDIVLLMSVNPGFGGQAFIPGEPHTSLAPRCRVCRCCDAMLHALRCNALAPPSVSRRWIMVAVVTSCVHTIADALVLLVSGTLDKLREARKMIDESGYDIALEIDGGVTTKNIKEIKEAGATMFVAGSAIFGSASHRSPRSRRSHRSCACVPLPCPLRSCACVRSRAARRPWCRRCSAHRLLRCLPPPSPGEDYKATIDEMRKEMAAAK